MCLKNVSKTRISFSKTDVQLETRIDSIEGELDLGVIYKTFVKK